MAFAFSNSPRRQNRKWLWGIGVLAVAIIIATVWTMLANSGGLVTEGMGRIGRPTREPLLQRVTIAGTTEAARTTIISAPYDGYIKALLVKQGQDVKKGSALVSIVQSLHADETVYPIRAPFSGRITQVLKTDGQFCKQGDSKDYILRLDDLSRSFIHAKVPEIDVLKLQVGMESTIKISAIQKHTYRGVVREIAEASGQSESWGKVQVEYLVKLEIIDPDALLRPGMTAVVDIITKKQENALTLSHEFIHRDSKGFFVVLKNGARRDVKIGLQNEIATEIIDGLNEGQEVRQVDFLRSNGNS